MKLIAPDRTSYALTRPTMTIGREPGNDIVLNDERVSRRHAQLQVQGATVSITDVGSRNGTLVNGRPVTTWQALNAGDVVSLGGLQLVYQAEYDMSATRAIGDVQPQPAYAPMPPPQPAPPYPPPAYAPPPVQPVPYPVYAPRPPKDRNTAILLEVIPGIFGIFGIGWMIAGNVGAGIALLAGNLMYLVIAAIGSAITAGLGLCFFWPLEVVFLVLSVTQLNKYTHQHPELFGP